MHGATIKIIFETLTSTTKNVQVIVISEFLPRFVVYFLQAGTEHHHRAVNLFICNYFQGSKHKNSQ